MQFAVSYHPNWGAASVHSGGADGLFWKGQGGEYQGRHHIRRRPWYKSGRERFMRYNKPESEHLDRPQHTMEIQRPSQSTSPRKGGGILCVAVVTGITVGGIVGVTAGGGVIAAGAGGADSGINALPGTYRTVGSGEFYIKFMNYAYILNRVRLL